MKLYKLVVNNFVASELLIINSSFKPSDEDIAISPYCWICVYNRIKMLSNGQPLRLGRHGCTFDRDFRFKILFLS